MEHYIISKFHTVPSAELIAEITELYQGALQVPGVTKVTIKTNVTPRPNRYDLMICIHLEKPEDLDNWDHCDTHKQWKEKYGSLLEKKAIFDCD